MNFPTQPDKLIFFSFPLTCSDCANCFNVNKIKLNDNASTENDII